jgi:hypothetical protein
LVIKGNGCKNKRSWRLNANSGEQGTVSRKQAKKQTQGTSLKMNIFTSTLVLVFFPLPYFLLSGLSFASFTL